MTNDFSVIPLGIDHHRILENLSSSLTAEDLLEACELVRNSHTQPYIKFTPSCLHPEDVEMLKKLDRTNKNKELDKKNKIKELKQKHKRLKKRQK